MEKEIRYCSKCQQPRAIDDFSFKNKSRGIRHNQCKFCVSTISKAHYKNNKSAYITRAKVRTDLVIEENRERLFAYLSSHPCVDCGKTDIRVLEFDHVHGKKSGNISRMVGEGFSWQTIDAEIARATASKDVDYRERGKRDYEEISERKCVGLKHFRRRICEKDFQPSGMSRREDGKIVPLQAL